jgi:hypothetical protein
MTLSNPYIVKIAEQQSHSSRKEILDTGVIGAVGAGTGLLGTKILKRSPKISASNLKTTALMGGLGLAGDYLAVKVNKRIPD